MHLTYALSHVTKPYHVHKKLDHSTAKKLTSEKSRTCHWSTRLMSHIEESIYMRYKAVASVQCQTAYFFTLTYRIEMSSD